MLVVRLFSVFDFLAWLVWFGFADDDCSTIQETTRKPTEEEGLTVVMVLAENYTPYVVRTYTVHDNFRHSTTESTLLEKTNGGDR